MSPSPAFPADEAHALLAAARSGDRAALGALMELFRGYLLSIADGELANGVRPKVQPSDVVQDAFLEASRLFDQFGGAEGDQFRAWLRSILLFKVSEAHGRFLGTEKRHLDREQSLDQSHADGKLRDALPGDASSPSRVASRTEDAVAVVRALDRLSETDRQVVTWRNWDGVPFAEIGRRLGKSEDAVRMLFVRALERLHAELERADDRPTAERPA